ncbi:DNA cytosine methyltransferase [Dysosmobacter welbionis]|uniref:DNA cytosine methyltransferase n=1 Tax=Dysosmobacter welbionis TaxID=2093857 RepID=UPI0034E3FFBA
MQTENLEGQESIFDRDSACGKMSSVLSQVGGTLKRVKKSLGRIFKKSSKRSSKLKNHTFMLLDLRPGAGNMLGAYWEYDPPWLGSFGMLNTSECPKDAVECSLWQILQATAPSRYSLSQTACLGILRRAACRGKSLPPLLETALRMQAGLDPPAPISDEAKAYHINQRNEGIDLDGVSGALMATQNLQMQTFITNPGSSQSGPQKQIAFAANQRDEVRDLHDVAGALQAQPGIKQQTFVAGFSAGAGASAGTIGYQEDVAPTLKGSPSGNCMPSILCINDQGGQIMECSENVTGTLRAQEHGHQPLILRPTGPKVYENHGIDGRYTGPHDVAPTMSARYGTGGNNIPLVQQEEVICIAGNAIDRQPQNGGNGFGWQRDIAYTLTATDKHAVIKPYQETVGALCRGDEKGIGNQYVSQDKCIIAGEITEEYSATNLVRRLTPLECERLQGYPDGWTDVPGASDSARYKALGNSVYLIMVVMRRTDVKTAPGEDSWRSCFT